MADDSFLKQCGGFNPAPDFLIQKYGFEAAHVWGAVWRYCQMSEKERPRSHEAMAERAGMSRRTFIKYLILLIKDGYIEDLDPGVRNRPHLYDTKKGEELIKVGMQISHTESSTQEDRYAELAQDNDVGMRNLHTSYAELAQPGMQNLHLIDSKEIQVKDTNKERESRPREKETHLQKLKRIGDVDYLSQNEAFATKLAEICGNPHPRYVVNGKRRELAESTAQLLDWGAAIEQLEEFRQQWKFPDPPWFNQVVSQWGRFLSSKDRPEQNGAKHNGATILERTEGSKPKPTGTAAALEAALRARARPSGAGA